MHNQTGAEGTEGMPAQAEDPELIAYRQELLSHRRWTDECRLAMSRDRDKMVLTIAGGSLAVSVAFLEKLSVLPSTWSIYLLLLGWVLEIVAIFVVLTSLHSSERALQHETKRLDAMLEDKECRNPGWDNPDGNSTEKLNAHSSVIAVAGVLLIVGFAAVNLVK